jgi:hypothetical protein
LIKSGTTIGLLADTPVASNCLPLRFLGRDIELPLQIPKLIQKYEIPSFWCCPLWHKGRIKIEIGRLPEPLPNERCDVWSERWFAAYLYKLEIVMRGHPENLGLFSGIWSNVSETFLRQRRKRSKDRQAENADTI